MVPEADYLELLNSLISSLYNMHLEIERTRKELLGHCGLQELMLLLEP
jgi:hypothetical protein